MHCDLLGPCGSGLPSAIYTALSLELTMILKRCKLAEVEDVGRKLSDTECRSPSSEGKSFTRDQGEAGGRNVNLTSNLRLGVNNVRIGSH
jgi:hypothetical protein